LGLYYEVRHHGGICGQRTRDHISRFLRLYDQINANAIDEFYLSDLEYKDNIFPDLDYRVYQTTLPARLRQAIPAMA